MKKVDATIELRDLYALRRGKSLKENQKYLKLLFNDHFLIFLMIAFGGAVLVYRSVMNQDLTIGSTGWTYWQLALFVWLSLGLLFGNLQTYFKKADAVFLSAGDGLLVHGYLKQAKVFSFVLSVFWQAIFFIVSLPIIANTDMDWVSAFLLFLLVLFLKVAMIEGQVASLISAKLAEQPKLLARVNWTIALITLWCFIYLNVWVEAIALFFSFLFAFLRVYQTRYMKKRGTISFYNAIALAEKEEGKHYGFFSLFAQVPGRQSSSKRRAYLDVIVNCLGKQSAYQQLIWKKLFRSQSGLNLVVRQVLVFYVLLLAVDSTSAWLFAALTALLIYLMGKQLLPFYEKVEAVLWTDLLFADKEKKQSDFRRVLTSINGFVTVLLSIALLPLQGVQAAAIVLVAGLVTTVVLDRFYFKQNLK